MLQHSGICAKKRLENLLISDKTNYSVDSVILLKEEIQSIIQKYYCVESFDIKIHSEKNYNENKSRIHIDVIVEDAYMNTLK